VFELKSRAGAKSAALQSFGTRTIDDARNLGSNFVLVGQFFYVPFGGIEAA
jgi:hypothetical protein